MVAVLLLSGWGVVSATGLMMLQLGSRACPVITQRPQLIPGREGASIQTACIHEGKQIFSHISLRIYKNDPDRPVQGAYFVLRCCGTFMVPGTLGAVDEDLKTQRPQLIPGREGASIQTACCDSFRLASLAPIICFSKISPGQKQKLRNAHHKWVPTR